MQAMLTCKELLREREKPLLEESEHLQSILTALANSVTPTHLQRWTEAAQSFPRKKVALLTSFPRTGTTLLEQMLDSHSGLISSDEREAFARDIFPAMWMTQTIRTPTIEALDAIPVARLAAQRERFVRVARVLQRFLAGHIGITKQRIDEQHVE